MTSTARDDLENLVRDLRPKLHRYCARMTGSVIDGEDVLQEALLKAFSALPESGVISNSESWLFRIAHNAALDFLRRRARRDAAHSNEDPEMIVDPESIVEDRQIVAAGLRTFMRLPVAQRSSVILMDVLGYSLAEIGTIMDAGIPAVKSALHRGRLRLRELAKEPDDLPPAILGEPERSLLAAYVDRFNARDFDAIREIIADEVRLELVDRRRLNGRREVANYFHNYAALHDWELAAGLVDGRPAAIVYEPGRSGRTPVYFVLLEWTGGALMKVRDFRYARYAVEGAEMRLGDGAG